MFNTHDDLLWFAWCLSVVYSEEVVIVGKGLVFLEIVGRTCTVSIFPVLLAAWARLLRVTAVEGVSEYFYGSRIASYNVV